MTLFFSNVTLLLSRPWTLVPLLNIQSSQAFIDFSRLKSQINSVRYRRAWFLIHRQLVFGARILAHVFEEIEDNTKRSFSSRLLESRLHGLPQQNSRDHKYHNKYHTSKVKDSHSESQISKSFVFTVPRRINTVFQQRCETQYEVFTRPMDLPERVVGKRYCLDRWGTPLVGCV